MMQEKMTGGFQHSLMGYVNQNELRPSNASKIGGSLRSAWIKSLIASIILGACLFLAYDNYERDDSSIFSMSFAADDKINMVQNVMEYDTAHSTLNSVVQSVMESDSSGNPSALDAVVQNIMEAEDVVVDKDLSLIVQQTMENDHSSGITMRNVVQETMEV
eukprot:CAMPEP_0182416292 /NCGR_PEP_ID=MMETSP1167-20130531/564_1 /TAXON_ID=2988 /ORGANISM="Mallomonas Sp, Strain CCMP3275" /LENGTH=160 /DNA_ID=CAMNT_0024588935 /DNA_START=60 /DNA_END=542 /DNA_ORIENTATION=-